MLQKELEEASRFDRERWLQLLARCGAFDTEGDLQPPKEVTLRESSHRQDIYSAFYDVEFDGVPVGLLQDSKGLYSMVSVGEAHLISSVERTLAELFESMWKKLFQGVETRPTIWALIYDNEKLTADHLAGSLWTTWKLPPEPTSDLPKTYGGLIQIPTVMMGPGVIRIVGEDRYSPVLLVVNGLTHALLECGIVSPKSAASFGYDLICGERHATLVLTEQDNVKVYGKILDK